MGKRQQVPLIFIFDTARDITLEGILTELGLRIQTETNAKEGLQRAMEDRPSCILVDYDMAVVSGCELTRVIKKNEYLKYTPVMICTPDENVDRAVAALEAGADDYLVRRADSRLIAEKIKAMLRISDLRSDMVRLAKTKDEYLSVLSHDLKSPIGVISASLQLMEEGIVGAVPDEMKPFIERSRRQASFALDLIDDILDFGQIENGMKLNVEKFQIGQLIAGCVENYEMALDAKNISLNIKIETEMTVEADLLKMSQVVNNLLGNAAKYTPEGGTITITASVFVGKRLADNVGKIVKVTVTDNGDGIPANKVSKIFERYQQAKLSDKKIGTGLGLAICNQIVKLHRGKIWAESVVGEGASFHFTMPNVIEAKKSVLLVDDNPTVRFVTKKLLENQGFLVYEANDGKQAIEMLVVICIDVVLLDINMPEMNGEEVLDVMRNSQEWAQIPVIMLTSEVEKSLLNKLTILAQGIIYKPANSDELRDKIYSVLSEGVNLDHEKPTILVVDDEPGILEMIVDILKKHDFNVLTAKNGMEGLFLFKSHNVSLVFTDITMPEMDGIEMAQHITNIDPKVPIIALSGYSEYEDTVSMYKFKEIIAKPFRAKAMRSVVKKYLGDSKPSRQQAS